MIVIMACDWSNAKYCGILSTVASLVLVNSIGNIFNVFNTINNFLDVPGVFSANTKETHAFQVKSNDLFDCSTIYEYVHTNSRIILWFLSPFT